MLYKRSSENISLVEHPVYCIFKADRLLSLVLWFCVVNTNPNSMCKIHFFRKIMVFCERRSDIASCVEQSLYIRLKVEKFLNCFC